MCHSLNRKEELYFKICCITIINYYICSIIHILIMFRLMDEILGTENFDILDVDELGFVMRRAAGFRFCV